MIPSEQQGGYHANINGRTLENTVKGVLDSKGFRCLSLEEKKLLVRSDGNVPGFKDRWYCPQVRLERNLYGSKYTSDFLVYDSVKFPRMLHIEVKWQGSSGSVDEKYVFTALSLLEFRGDTLLILGGGGARQGAVQWLSALSSKNRKNFKFIGGIDTFIQWANYEL